eukprot:4717270-Alexandrium_andersonii.AAC.1
MVVLNIACDPHQRVRPAVFEHARASILARVAADPRSPHFCREGPIDHHMVPRILKRMQPAEAVLARRAMM